MTQASWADRVAPPAFFLFFMPLATLALVYGFLFSIWGRVEVVIGRESSIFVGVGPLGLRRGFDWDAVTAIDQGMTILRYNARRRPVIQLHGPGLLRFGTFLKKERLAFLLACLQRVKATRRRT